MLSPLKLRQTNAAVQNIVGNKGQLGKTMNKTQTRFVSLQATAGENKQDTQDNKGLITSLTGKCAEMEDRRSNLRLVESAEGLDAFGFL